MSKKTCETDYSICSTSCAVALVAMFVKPIADYVPGRKRSTVQ